MLSISQTRNMDNRRLSKEKQTLVLMALCEGTPVRACARMFRVGKGTITRLIRETGEAFADYMDKELRDLPCERVEMDEQWQYVGHHASRKSQPREIYNRPWHPVTGDFWLWGGNRRGHETGFLASRR